MINRISEIPLWGPEEQIRKFIHMVDIPSTGGTLTQTLDDGTQQEVTQQEITQQRIEKIDEIFQKQLIWSYGISGVDDAYFYWDWCPIGAGTE